MFETVPGIRTEVGFEELTSSLNVNALPMTNSNEFSIGNINDCKRFTNSKKLLAKSLFCDSLEI